MPGFDLHRVDNSHLHFLASKEREATWKQPVHFSKVPLLTFPHSLFTCFKTDLLCSEVFASSEKNKKFVGGKLFQASYLPWKEMSTNIQYWVTDARTYCSVSDATCFAKKLMFFWEKQTCHALEENVVVSSTSLKTSSFKQTTDMQTQSPLPWQNKSCCTWLVHIVAFFGADKGMQAIESWQLQDVVEFFNSWFQKCSNNTSLTLKTCHSHICLACPNLQSSAHYKQVSQFTIKVHITIKYPNL